MSGKCDHIVRSEYFDAKYDAFRISCARCGKTIRDGLPISLAYIPYHHSITHDGETWMNLYRIGKATRDE